MEVAVRLERAVRKAAQPRKIDHVSIFRWASEGSEVAENTRHTGLWSRIARGAYAPELAFTVSNLNDHGAGSLRQAILNANSNPGADTINFAVAGTITLNSALPTIAGTGQYRRHIGPRLRGNARGRSRLQQLRPACSSLPAPMGRRCARWHWSTPRGNGVTLNCVQQM